MENPIDSTVPSPNERGLFDRFLGWLRQSKDEESMNKNELIAQLVANKQCKLPKERLEKWEEADLAAFAESLAVHEEEAAPATPTEPAQSSATPTMPPEFTQFLDAVRGIDMGKLKEALGAISANADHERSVLIADIKANERNSFDDGELSAMPTAQLRKLQSSLLPRDYSLAGGYFRTHAGGDEYELAMPDAWPKKEG